LLATFGYANVKVAKRPKVSLISTGTELLDVKDKLQPGKIRNSNGPMLAAQLDRMGVSYESFGMMKDDLDASTKIIKSALETTHISSANDGVSVGDWYYLPK